MWQEIFEDGGELSYQTEFIESGSRDSRVGSFNGPMLMVTSPLIDPPLNDILIMRERGADASSGIFVVGRTDDDPYHVADSRHYDHLDGTRNNYESIAREAIDVVNDQL